MAAPGDMPGQDEGFAEIDTQEDEAMEVANSAWEQEGKLVWCGIIKKEKCLSGNVAHESDGICWCTIRRKKMSCQACGTWQSDGISW